MAAMIDTRDELHADALQRLDHHYQSMPPVAAMQVGIAGYDGRALRLHAPLAAHVNDKGCAFGGSLASMMTLASWGLVSLQLEAAGLQADVYVADSQVRYLAPLFTDLDVEARFGEDADPASFVATLRERGRARIQLAASARLPDGGLATTFNGRYVAIART
ncbi:YiiD C-terminal domain-containing protein [Montanilutibacter psychrotolerans]|nr:YiiD C-terminal domain-containing protein [Lysobacter psychrotolerans]